MNGPRGYYAQWNKLVKEKQVPYDLTRIENKINEQTKLKQTHRYIKQTDGCQREGGWEAGWKGEGLRSTNWYLQNSPGDVKYSIGNIVNNI